MGYFDPLGLSKVDEPTLKKYRESEIKVKINLILLSDTESFLTLTLSDSFIPNMNHFT